jgi:hypothetical protein
MSLSKSARRAPVALVLASLLLGGCGESLASMVMETMDACIAARNPLFVSGRGAEALDTPLPAEALATAERLNYTRASEMFQEIATSAGDQVTLVCALDLSSRWKHADARKFIARYAEHPDAAVATAARRLSER